MQRRVDLSPPRGGEWLKLWRLYLRAFPAAERKPIRRILKKYRHGLARIWAIRRDGTFAGLVMTAESPALVQLDYLAVSPEERNSGLGGEALRLLRENLNGRPMFLEIEDADLPGPDQDLRRRRRGFYLRCGMEPLGIRAQVYDVRMELLGWDCEMTFDDYIAFYRDWYRPQAAEKIRQV